MPKPPDDRATAAVVASLSTTEQAALPSRLRSLVADDATHGWNAAKAARDAALEAAEGLTDPDQRVAAIDAAKAEWAAYKTAHAAEV